MSMNNVIPWWVLDLEAKSKELTTEEMVEWLYNDGYNQLPEEVYQHQLAFYTNKLHEEYDNVLDY